MIKFEDNTAYWCKTEELANKLLKEADRQGFRWCDDESYLHKNDWNDYKEDTCYLIKRGEYCSKTWFEENGYKIVEVTEETNRAEEWLKSKGIEIQYNKALPTSKVIELIHQYAQEQVKEALESLSFKTMSDAYLAGQESMNCGCYEVKDCTTFQEWILNQSTSNN